MTSRWNNPTGGFGYHLRAFSRRRTLWAPFARNIARWLAAWAPTETEIVLIGPSGGHCLDLSFLRRFARIVAVDIDPFAPWVFRWRARHVLRQMGTVLTWDARDHLSPGPEGFALAPVRALLDAHPDAAVLFCNILGQLPLLGEDRDPEQRDDAPPEGSYEHWLLGLAEALEGRTWATFHDRISGPVRPRAIDSSAPVAWASSQDIVTGHYPLTDDPDLALVEHRTSVLLPDEARWQFVWELAPGMFHLIEAMSFRAGESPAAPPAT
jgi:hypothetical protein